MILSSEALFSDAQAITANSFSTNVIDTGVAQPPYGGAIAPNAHDIGGGVEIPISFAVPVKFAGLTSLTVQVVSSVNPTLATPKILSSQTFTLAELNANPMLNIKGIPRGAVNRYLGIFYTVVGVPTAGAVTAGISMGTQTNIHGA